MTFRAEFSGSVEINLFEKPSETATAATATEDEEKLAPWQFESAALQIMIGTENSVSVEISFNVEVVAGEPPKTFTGKSSYSKLL